MITSEPFCMIYHSCDDALHWTKVRLSQAGLRVLQTFDLQTARRTLADCPCPHHGLESCDCQMVVLLVYEPFLPSSNQQAAPEPATLILHGNDGKTWLSLINDSRHQVDPVIRSQIEQLLKFK
jgi:hypothetical protein